ncbi:uncharacterized protein LOC132061355 [Lycium ferocissimum]|uniref:uncharacterized protein LOC132061355 n=1 Tax=Lycium ferocissimum TaxID=112874 RepID=UPI00281622A9|nr:uncharacterized protein LOC132061355 [Lycium ferocissimum]
MFAEQNEENENDNNEINPIPEEIHQNWSPSKTEEREGFMDVVKKAWDNDFQGNFMWMVKNKLKTLSKALSKLSKDNIGDVFETIKQMEKHTKQIEEQYENDSSDGNNDALDVDPTEEEVKNVIFSMDFILVLMGIMGTSFKLHGAPDQFSQIRPISLSKFTNKILSKIITIRLAPILPKLISENQSGFIKGRLITENILLTQEIVHGIKGGKDQGNLVMKLDMPKAYDKVSCVFLMSVLGKIRFREYFIELIYRLISDNWYYVIVNDSRHDFFYSSRGLKQGDPLSPTLFIIGAEVLTKVLNHLNNKKDFIGFNMSRNDPQVNHLCMLMT